MRTKVETSRADSGGYQATQVSHAPRHPDTRTPSSLACSEVVFVFDPGGGPAALGALPQQLGGEEDDD